jgi:hypothetical protein
VLEAELETLKAVLDNPQRYLHFESTHLRLNTMNVLLDDKSSEPAAEVDFAVVELSGANPQCRAFVLARVARTELPPPKKLDLDHAARYL